MAAKAGSQPSTWLYLRDAKALVSETGGRSLALAERLIAEACESGDLPWSCDFIQKGRGGPLGTTDANFRGEPSFWCLHALGTGQITRRENFAESWLSNCTRDDDFMFWGVKVLQAAVVALLPSAPLTVPVKRRSGPQINRVRKVMPRLFPPKGKVPVGTSVETVWSKVVAELKADSKAKNMNDPSPDVVEAVIKELGRHDD
jgi:hypothetical protein